jgi:hypothetical protein
VLSEEEKLRLVEMTQHVKLLEMIIRSYNKWQRELATLSGKRKPAEHERSRLSEVQRHVRINQESVRQMCRLQGDITSLVTKGALTDAERMRLEANHKQARELNDMVTRTLKLQGDLAALNVKAIAKSGLTDAEKARAAVLRNNLEPIAAEIRIADRKREEPEGDALKRAAEAQRSRLKRVERLWKDLSEHMRRRDISAKKLYRQFDESGSGEISYWELFRGIQSIGVTFDEDDTDLLMADVDKEKRGVIPFPAFDAKLKELDPAWQQRVADKARARAEAEAKAKENAGSLYATLFGAEPVALVDDDDDEEEEEEEVAVDSKGAIESGTPVMAQHSTGDYFRATVVKDNLDGTCDVQFVLATLGRDAAKSKKRIRSLAQEDELRGIWVEVSKAVGRRGGAELRSKADFAGMLSHEALVTWLEERDMDTMSEQVKYSLLADVDPLHAGAVAVGRFLEKLEHFRARSKIMGLTVFHRHDKEIAHEEEDEEEEVATDKKKGHNEEVREVVSAAGAGSPQAQIRMAELEALIFAMAKRQQELALALSASEARTASLNAAVQSIKDEPVYGGEPLLKSNGGSGGLYIMPDMKDGEVVWLNKNTGMRFSRVAVAAAAAGGKKKKKKKPASSLEAVM